MNSLVKMIVTIIFILVTSFSFKTPDDSIIKWTPERKLKITDFVQVEDRLPNGATAVTSTGIFLERTNKRTCGYIAYAVFDKVGSKWYIHGQIEYSQLILQHEQIHFDITNYMARELDNNLKKAINIEQVNLLYNIYQSKLDSMQVWYDKSSDHSRDPLSQSYWNRRVDSLLKAQKY